MTIKIMNDFPHSISFHECTNYTDFYINKAINHSLLQRTERDIDIYFDEFKVEKLSDNSFNVLIRTEPQIVQPLIYLKSVIDRYNLVLDLGKFNEHINKSIKWPIHSCVFLNLNLQKKYRLNKAVLIASKKISFHPLSLYHLRFDLARSGLIEIYGKSWNLNSLTFIRNLAGALIVALKFKYPIKLSKIFKLFQKIYSYKKSNFSNKVDIYSKYDIAVVIENDNNYVSEKFFEALVSGSTVIYVGGALERFDIPADIYLKGETDFLKLSKQISQTLSNSELREKVQKNARDWISTNPNNFIKWHEGQVWKDIMSIILYYLSKG